MDRRRMISGAGAGEALRAALTERPGEADAVPGTWDRNEGALQLFSFDAMGCRVQLFFPAGVFARAGDAVTAAMDLVDSLENEISVYRQGSDLNRINQLATTRPVPVDGTLAELVEQSLAWFARTGGAFDCTMGPLSKLWGFRARQPVLPSQQEIAAALQQVGSSQIEWNPDARTVRLLNPGTEIDFNGIGKGYILGQVAELLMSRGIDRWLIHSGQSSVTAHGNDSDFGNETSAGWTVGVSHPLVANRRLAEVRLQDRSLGTSGSARQVLVRDGRRYGHVLDPRTGWPADHWISMTVVHRCPVACDVLSTALFVMSPAEVDAFATQNRDVGVVAIRQDSNTGKIETVQKNFAPGEIRLL